MEREIIHRCGHAQRRHVAGYFVVDQDREAARLARRPCPACVRAGGAGQGRGAAGAALPPLTGSPRQVAWATRIRQAHLAALGRLDPAGLAHAASMVDARWWIDHRPPVPGPLTSAP